ncbi:vWA domain-containing protein [Butyrivibrio sp. INlla14]|uniref:vWA domain-containing protein n=1 Tax=Butyrivibrio sp. INlla14 TaxID=1520808 RepID=UPI000876C086|nr:vWA domain-containing protein [Butyrivibrio sp. INlla14]SCY63016.1 hypothetical protein SAMN02910371_03109 [Butyrivibrio sp. INlla14]
MKKGLTEIVYILDRSGSMGGLEADTIGGFNAMIKKQKKAEGQAIVSTVLFDDEYEVLHNRIDIKDVPKMTDKQYFVRGCTALLDAVGTAVNHIKKVHKDLPKYERPEKTIFVITTDGMENASYEYSYESIKKLIEKQQKKDGWEFMFIGANIDSYAEAGRLGIKKSRTANYVHDELGTSTVYKGMAKAVCSVMMAPSLDAVDECLEESGWDVEITADFAERGGR